MSDRIREWFDSITTKDADGHITVKPSCVGTKLRTNGRQLRLVQVAYFLRYGEMQDASEHMYRYSPSCPVPGCLAHRLRCQLQAKIMGDCTSTAVSDRVRAWFDSVTVKDDGGHVTLKAGCVDAALRINGRQLHPGQVAYFLRYGGMQDTARYMYRHLPTCLVAGCLAHRLRCQRRPESIEDMQADDYEYACACLQSHGVQDGDCLLWQGGRDAEGYGQCSFLPTIFGSKPGIHRVAWSVYNMQSVPAGLVVRHRCPRRHNHCYAPQHLDVGTDDDNGKDRIRDGTQPRGEKNAAATITEAVAKQIKESREGGETQAERATRFSCSLAVVSQIDTGKTWTHLWSKEDLEEHHRSRRKRKAIPSDVKEQILESGLSARECAIEFDVPAEFVWRIRREKRQKKPKPTEKERRELAYAEARDRLERKSKKETDAEGRVHWRWTGHHDANGYGYMSFCNEQRGVHIVSWLVFHDLPESVLIDAATGQTLQMRHRCVHHDCCNVACLLGPGTPKQQAQDNVDFGRAKFGPEHHSAKFTRDQVVAIRASTKSTQALAEEYNVTPECIRNVRQRRTYANVA